jgi:hypothetical protein
MRWWIEGGGDGRARAGSGPGVYRGVRGFLRRQKDKGALAVTSRRRRCWRWTARVGPGEAWWKRNTGRCKLQGAWGAGFLGDTGSWDMRPAGHGRQCRVGRHVMRRRGTRGCSRARPRPPGATPPKSAPLAPVWRTNSLKMSIEPTKLWIPKL